MAKERTTPVRAWESMEIQNLQEPKQNRSKLGLILAGIFLLLVAVATIYVFYFAPKTAELSGVVLIIFAIPWIFFTLSLGSNAIIVSISIVLSILINAILIYFLGNFFGNAVHGVDAKLETVRQVSADEANKLWKKFNVFFWIIFVLSFSYLLQIFFPINYLIGVIGLTRIASTIGGVITLSYFGYAMTLKKYYLFFGILGFFNWIGLIIGYILLFWVKRNAMKNQSL